MYIWLAGLQSSWSTCTLALPINTDLGWVMWLTGFSLSLWLRLDKTTSIQWRIPPTFQRKSGSDTTQSESYSDSFSEIWQQNSKHTKYTLCMYDLIRFFKGSYMYQKIWILEGKIKIQYSKCPRIYRFFFEFLFNCF